MLNQPKTYVKAIYAAAIAFLGTLMTALVDSGVTVKEWVGIALTTVLAAGGVYGFTNAPVTQAMLKKRAARRGERGQTLNLVVWVVLGLLAAFALGVWLGHQLN